MTYQRGIVEQNLSAIYQTYEANGDAKKICAATIEVYRLNQKFPSVCVTVSFGYKFWKTIHSAMPASFEEFRELKGSSTVAPSTGGDVFVHIASNSHDANFEVACCASDLLCSTTKIQDETHGFHYQDSRDLTGFIDGTANPKGEGRRKAAFISDQGPFSEGSFLMVQKYNHNLKKWTKLADQEQEKVIGRTKKDSIELKGDQMPSDSHVSRVEISDSQGRELPIVRHSLPCGSGSGDKGLFFIAYAKDIRIFDRMLANMHGLSEDRITDSLMNYSEAVSGAYFFTPSVELLESLA